MDDDRPKTIRLSHPQHGVVICNVGEEASWLEIGYAPEGALVKAKRVKAKVKLAQSEASDVNEVTL